MENQNEQPSEETAISIPHDLDCTTSRLDNDGKLRKELPDESIIGYMLPLNGGHNGAFSLPELNLFQKHLINAQIVELADNPDISPNSYKGPEDESYINNIESIDPDIDSEIKKDEDFEDQ